MSLALALASASFLFVLSPLQTAQATQGFPIYSWGDTASSRLGRPVVGTDNQVPVRMGDRNDWVLAASASGGSKAIDTQGRLWTWGPSGDQRGLGPSPGLISVATQITYPSRTWTRVASLANVVAAITDQGHLYTWGHNASGHLGHGDTAIRNIPTRIEVEPNCQRIFTHVSIGTSGGALSFALTDEGYIYSWGSTASATGLGRPDNVIPRDVPGRVETPHNNWVIVESGANRVGMAICEDGYLYSWGTNVSALGRPIGAAHLYGGVAANRPGRVGGISNVVDVVMTNNVAAAVTADGYLYTWGAEGDALGRPFDATAPANRPGRVGDNNNWTAVMGGWQHFLALTEESEIFAWGLGANGRLGLGDNNNRNEPTLVGYVVGAAGAARGGGSHSLVLMEGFSFTPVETNFNLTKHLQKPEGTPAPNLTFTFTVERNSFNNNSTPADIARIPEIGSITLNPTTVVSPAPPPVGTVTLRAYADILDGILFEEVGTFSWIISEVQSATGIGPDSSVVFSQAQYDLRVYVFREPGPLGDLYVRYMTLHRIQNADGTTPQDGREKVNNLIFVNLYTYDPLIIPTGLWLTGGSLYLVVFTTGVALTAYLSLRARKRIEDLPIMH